MPAIVPFIPLIVAGVTGTTAGLQLADVGTGSPQKDAAAQLAKQQAAQATADQQAQQKSIRATLANAQEQSGGDLPGGGLVNLASIIAGIPGSGGTSTTGKAALADYLGTSQTPANGGGNLVSSTFGLNGGQG